MTSAQNPNVSAIKSLIEGQGLSNVDIELDHPDVPALMASCDLAVMAGGTSVYEAAFCGLPMILIAIASNQEGQCKGWDGLRAARYLGNIQELRERHLLSCTLSLLDDRDARMNMARAGRDNVDLKGATRLLEALFERELGFEVIQ
ncbi:glycosyl transferases group 1 family protein (plasmid) [Sinorhizobium sp. RAC02]|nr:glycosyl transferases group 1 family protein [Sinorhizobium sp. RAC02]